MSLRRKLFLFALVASLIGIGLYFGVHWFTVGRYVVTTNNAYVEADIGVIAPRVQGYVREVRVQDNQPVKAGDILVVLEDGDYRAKLAQADAAIATARANLENVGASSEKQKSAIAAAAADIDAKIAEEHRAAEDLARVGKLRDDQWVSAQRWQSAEAEAQKTAAELQGARAGFNSQRAQMQVLGAQARVAVAYYKQQVAARQVAQIDLDNTVLRAPVDGVVGNRAVRVGQFARPGTILMAVVPLSQVYVVANFKETQLEHLRVGQKVMLAVDAYDGREIGGVVESISPAAGSRFSILPPENATGNFTKIVQRLPVKVRLVDLPKDMRLTPGMSVEASIDTRKKS